jgi:hypothetical protein
MADVGAGHERGARVAASPGGTLPQGAWLYPPAPVVEVRSYDVAGKTVLVLSVERGDSQPYGLLHGGRVEYFVRRDATTFPARPEDIRSSVLASASVPAPAGQWGY